MPRKSTHTTKNRNIRNNVIYSGKHIYNNTYKTSEYAETKARTSEAPFFSGTVDWGLRTPSTSDKLLENSIASMSFF